MLMSSESHAQFIIPLISSLCSAQSQLPHTSHLFSQLCPLHAATSLSVVKVSLFFSSSSSSFCLLQWEFLCIFFFNFICLIWFEKYILNESFDQQNTKQHRSATKNHQVPTLIWFFFFFYLSKFFFSDLACFVLAKDLFVLLLGTEKNLWVHAL